MPCESEHVTYVQETRALIGNLEAPPTRIGFWESFETPPPCPPFPAKRGKGGFETPPLPLSGPKKEGGFRNPPPSSQKEGEDFDTPPLPPLSSKKGGGFETPPPFPLLAPSLGPHPSLCPP